MRKAPTEMTGRAQRDVAQGDAASDPDQLEVVEGTHHQKLEGWVPELAGDEELCDALEQAFDYRGDITITIKNGHKIESYIFACLTGPTLAQQAMCLIL